jgi:hypothetical protein
MPADFTSYKLSSLSPFISLGPCNHCKLACILYSYQRASELDTTVRKHLYEECLTEEFTELQYVLDIIDGRTSVSKARADVNTVRFVIFFFFLVAPTRGSVLLFRSIGLILLSLLIRTVGRTPWTGDSSSQGLYLFTNTEKHMHIHKH